MAENTNKPAEAKPGENIKEIDEIIDYFLDNISVDGLPATRMGVEDAEYPDLGFNLDRAKAQDFIIAKLKAMFERAKQTKLTDEAALRNKQKAEDEAEEIPDDEIKGEE